MVIKDFLHRKKNEHNFSPKQIAELAGVGVRFVYEMLEGKPLRRLSRL